MPKQTVAETVIFAAKYLVDDHGQTSLAGLKKYLLAECGEVYVARNYDRIKKQLKEMFSSKEIYAVHRSKTSRPPAVTAQFKFRAVKKNVRRVSSAHLKMVQKTARAANKKKAK